MEECRYNEDCVKRLEGKCELYHSNESRFEKEYQKQGRPVCPQGTRCNVRFETGGCSNFHPVAHRPCKHRNECRKNKYEGLCPFWHPEVENIPGPYPDKQRKRAAESGDNTSPTKRRRVATVEGSPRTSPGHRRVVQVDDAELARGPIHLRLERPGSTRAEGMSPGSSRRVAITRTGKEMEEEEEEEEEEDIVNEGAADANPAPKTVSVNIMSEQQYMVSVLRYLHEQGGRVSLSQLGGPCPLENVLGLAGKKLSQVLARPKWHGVVALKAGRDGNSQVCLAPPAARAVGEAVMACMGRDAIDNVICGLAEKAFGHRPPPGRAVARPSASPPAADRDKSPRHQLMEMEGAAAAPGGSPVGATAMDTAQSLSNTTAIQAPQARPVADDRGTTAFDQSSGGSKNRNEGPKPPAGERSLPLPVHTQSPQRPTHARAGQGSQASDSRAPGDQGPFVAPSPAHSLSQSAGQGMDERSTLPLTFEVNLHEAEFTARVMLRVFRHEAEQSPGSGILVNELPRPSKPEQIPDFNTLPLWLKRRLEGFAVDIYEDIGGRSLARLLPSVTERISLAGGDDAAALAVAKEILVEVARDDDMHRSEPNKRWGLWEDVQEMTVELLAARILKYLFHMKTERRVPASELVIHSRSQYISHPHLWHGAASVKDWMERWMAPAVDITDEGTVLQSDYRQEIRARWDRAVKGKEERHAWYKCRAIGNRLVGMARDQEKAAARRLAEEEERRQAEEEARKRAEEEARRHAEERALAIEGVQAAVDKGRRSVEDVEKQARGEMNECEGRLKANAEELEAAKKKSEALVDVPKAKVRPPPRQPQATDYDVLKAVDILLHLLHMERFGENLVHMCKTGYVRGYSYRESVSRLLRVIGYDKARAEAGIDFKEFVNSQSVIFNIDDSGVAISEAVRHQLYSSAAMAIGNTCDEDLIARTRVSIVREECIAICTTRPPFSIGDFPTREALILRVIRPRDPVPPHVLAAVDTMWHLYMNSFVLHGKPEAAWMPLSRLPAGRWRVKYPKTLAGLYLNGPPMDGFRYDMDPTSRMERIFYKSRLEVAGHSHFRDVSVAFEDWLAADNGWASSIFETRRDPSHDPRVRLVPDVLMELWRSMGTGGVAMAYKAAFRLVVNAMKPPGDRGGQIWVMRASEFMSSLLNSSGAMDSMLPMMECLLRRGNFDTSDIETAMVLSNMEHTPPPRGIPPSPHWSKTLLMKAISTKVVASDKASMMGLTEGFLDNGVLCGLHYLIHSSKMCHNLAAWWEDEVYSFRKRQADEAAAIREEISTLEKEAKSLTSKLESSRASLEASAETAQFIEHARILAQDAVSIEAEWGLRPSGELGADDEWVHRIEMFCLETVDAMFMHQARQAEGDGVPRGGELMTLKELKDKKIPLKNSDLARLNPEEVPVPEWLRQTMTKDVELVSGPVRRIGLVMQTLKVLAVFGKAEGSLARRAVIGGMVRRAVAVQVEAMRKRPQSVHCQADGSESAGPMGLYDLDRVAGKETAAAVVTGILHEKHSTAREFLESYVVAEGFGAAVSTKALLNEGPWEVLLPDSDTTSTQTTMVRLPSTEPPARARPPAPGAVSCSICKSVHWIPSYGPAVPLVGYVEYERILDDEDAMFAALSGPGGPPPPVPPPQEVILEYTEDEEKDTSTTEWVPIV